MALRTLLLVSLGAASTLVANATPVRHYTLDDRTVYAVRIATGAPTTITFPGPITAVEGAGISSKAEDQPPVLISHQPDSSFFSVRALQSDANAAANIIYRGRVFAFTFTASESPDRTLTFREKTERDASPATKRVTVARLLSLMDRAKHFSTIAEQYPAIVQSIAHATPNTTAVSGAVACTVEAIFGFADEDAVVLRLRLENRGDAMIRYAPAQLAVRVAGANFPSAINDASGQLASGRAEIVHVVVVGNPDGIQAPLSVKNEFMLALPLRE